MFPDGGWGVVTTGVVTLKESSLSAEAAARPRIAM